MGSKTLVQESSPTRLSTKLISIATVRHPAESGPQALEYRDYISRIEFDNPVSIKGEKNKNITLKTAWFASNSGYYWRQWLDNERGIVFANRNLPGGLRGSFYDYSEDKLRTWQEEALTEHRKVLGKLENIYYGSEEPEIPESLLSGHVLFNL